MIIISMIVYLETETLVGQITNDDTKILEASTRISGQYLSLVL